MLREFDEVSADTANGPRQSHAIYQDKHDR
jgi:hypothetical protein